MHKMLWFFDKFCWFWLGFCGLNSVMDRDTTYSDCWMSDDLSSQFPGTDIFFFLVDKGYIWGGAGGVSTHIFQILYCDLCSCRHVQQCAR